MRITRELLFDWTEMVGRAIAGAKDKPAKRTESLSCLLGGIPEPEDEWGVMGEAGWVDPDERAILRDARTSHRDHAFEVSKKLCELQRGLQFRDYGVHEAFRRLAEICRDALPLVSKVWAKQVHRILDEFGRKT